MIASLIVHRWIDLSPASDTLFQTQATSLASRNATPSPKRINLNQRHHSKLTDVSSLVVLKQLYIPKSSDFTNQFELEFCQISV